jgi:hypothetical protein
MKGKFARSVFSIFPLEAADLSRLDPARRNEQEIAARELDETGFSNIGSMFGRGMPTARVFTACQELIVQSIDLARLIGRDILLMQGSQLVLGWLIIAAIVNRPWSPVE